MPELKVLMKVGPILTSFFLLLILIHSMEYPMKYNYTTDYNHPHYYSGIKSGKVADRSYDF